MIAVPDEREPRLEHLILDANGTLTDRGALLARLTPKTGVYWTTATTSRFAGAS